MEAPLWRRRRWPSTTRGSTEWATAPPATEVEAAAVQAEVGAAARRATAVRAGSGRLGGQRAETGYRFEGLEEQQAKRHHDRPWSIADAYAAPRTVADARAGHLPLLPLPAGRVRSRQRPAARRSASPVSGGGEEEPSARPQGRQGSIGRGVPLRVAVDRSTPGPC